MNLARLFSMTVVTFGTFVLASCGGESINVGDLGRTIEQGAIIAGEDPERARQYGETASALTGAVAGIDEQAERQLGSGIAVQAFSQVGPMHPSTDLQRYVNLVGRAVARQSTRPKLPWSFAVLQSDAPNAFAAPGGYVFITTGALELMNDEAELAGVLGHEIAHVAQGHILQTYRRGRYLEAIQTTAQTIDNDQDVQEYSEAVDFGTDLLFNRGLDQRFEFEADIIGAELTALTGYDPDGFKRFLRHLMGASDKTGGWFSTHPDFGERISRLEALMPDLENTQAVTNADRFSNYVDRSLKPAAQTAMD